MRLFSSVVWLISKLLTASLPLSTSQPSMDAISCSHERSGGLHSVDLARAAVLDRGDLRAGTRGESLFLLRSPRRTCFLNNLSRPPRRTKYSSNAGESLARQFSTLGQACMQAYSSLSSTSQVLRDVPFESSYWTNNSIDPCL